MKKWAILCWAFICSFCWVTFDRKLSKIMKFHVHDDKDQLLVKLLGNLTHVSHKRQLVCNSMRRTQSQKSAQIHVFFFSTYTVHDWKSRQWTMIAIFLGTEERKSNISRWVLLVYKLILIVYWNVTTNMWLRCTVHSQQRITAGNLA